MSARKKLYEYIITGKTSDGNPMKRTGTVEMERFDKAKPLVKEIKKNHVWGEDAFFSSLYTDVILNAEMKSVTDEMIGSDIVYVENIEVFKGTKTLKL